MSQRLQQLANALFCGIEATEPSAVKAILIEIENTVLGADQEPIVQEKLLNDTVKMFLTGFANKQPVDTPYHNLEHTLQTTLCFAQLALNWKLTEQSPELSREDFQNGLAAALLHDVGYMKDANDEEGSGAKHTLGHERRSCEIASTYLTGLGWSSQRIATVRSIICCTGPLADFGSIEFANEVAKRLGQMVCTADYLGQIADPGYVDKIPALYREFYESDQAHSIPFEHRNYTSLDELFQGTDSFWKSFVEPRLRDECDAIYELLSDRATGENAYIKEVQANLKRIEQLNSAASS